MKLCERCFRRIDEEKTYCYICKLKIENENLRGELSEWKKNWKEDVLALEKKYEIENCFLRQSESWCNHVRRHLMKELKGHGCCCKNCFYLSKCTDGTFTCSATRFDFEIDKKRIDKCICFRYAFDKKDVKEN